MFEHLRHLEEGGSSERKEQPKWIGKTLTFKDERSISTPYIVEQATWIGSGGYADVYRVVIKESTRIHEHRRVLVIKELNKSLTNFFDRRIARKDQKIFNKLREWDIPTWNTLRICTENPRLILLSDGERDDALLLNANLGNNTPHAESYITSLPHGETLHIENWEESMKAMAQSVVSVSRGPMIQVPYDAWLLRCVPSHKSDLDSKNLPEEENEPVFNVSPLIGDFDLCEILQSGREVQEYSDVDALLSINLNYAAQAAHHFAVQIARKDQVLLDSFIEKIYREFSSIASIHNVVFNPSFREFD